MRVALRQAGTFGGIEPRVHTGQNGKTSTRWGWQFGLLAKILGVGGVGCDDFLSNLTHRGVSFTDISIYQIIVSLS